MLRSKSEGVLFKTGLMVAVSAALLVGCGGGGGGDSASSSTGSAGSSNLQSVGAAPANDLEAHRFLTQATFGATSSDISRVKAIGYERWIDEQLATSLQTSHLAMAEASHNALQTDQPRAADVVYSWWTHAVNDPAQLRQRIAFALSEIFVVSTVDTGLSQHGRMVASYLDMLTGKVDGNYRDLIEGVALHPAMGIYMSHLSNRKEDTVTGRTPDENFAREIMQLMSIGLYELNDDGSLKLDNGQPKETYTSNDVKGMARVFTGWSWYQPPAKAGLAWWMCYVRTTQCQDDSQLVTAMSPYAQEHSVSAKTFLGTTIPAQSTADPRGDLRIALDRLASHPNTAPFISKQLIQRLVTSNPSPTYVADITAQFRTSSGNIKAVVKAILMHPEARNLAQQNVTTYGKLREPVLRLAHVLRAVPHTSDTYLAARTNGAMPFYLASSTDDPATQLGQTPMNSPSVFNFFRPGYAPPQTTLSTHSMVSPEMQITNETSVLGYANFLASGLENGMGQYNATSRQMDIRFDLSAWQPLADQPRAAQPQALISAVAKQILGGPAPTTLNDQMVSTIGHMAIATTQDRRRRVQAAILMIAVSPDFIVQQ